MKILFIGFGNNQVTFINRRIEGLKKENIDVILPKEIKNFHLITLIKFFFKHPIRIINFFRILSLKKGNIKSKIKTAIKYADFLHHNPDLLHFQWNHHVRAFKWLIDYYKVPVVASVRGSMVTVHAYNNPQYIKELHESFALTDYVHTVSESLRQICIKEFNVSPEKVFTNYNGIDYNFFQPSKKQKKTDSLTLISVGSLMWRKSHLFQLLVMKKLENYPIKLIWIGTGEDEFKLRYQIKKLNLTDKVILTGKKSEKEVVNYLQHADIYISTSIAEGLSNSVMEAASCALPVIAFECEGMREIITPEKTGYIIPFGDVDAMASVILELYKNPQKRTNFGKNARNYIMKNFDINYHVKKMIEKYEEIIQKK